jgi:uncharacterized protein YuzE
MKIRYDREADVIYIAFINEPVTDSDEQKPGIIFDYSLKGNLAGIEILNASQLMAEPGRVDFVEII